MKLLSTFFLLFLSLTAAAQTAIVLKGTVTSQAGTPVPSATVIIVNSTRAAASDKAGRFSFTLAQGTYQLSVSALGFATQLTTVALGPKASKDLVIRLKASEQQLSEVVVNAEKKQQDVQKVPAAVTVLDAKQIRDYRLWDITNLTAIAPNLFVVEHGNSASSNFFNIRGVMGFSNEQAVATYVDGVYQFDYFSAPPTFN
ncbi:MAG: TonB-dependent receptor, partial [Hymenobacter sp.]